jgi:hypothetical protein
MSWWQLITASSQHPGGAPFHLFRWQPQRGVPRNHTQPGHLAATWMGWPPTTRACNRSKVRHRGHPHPHPSRRFGLRRIALPRRTRETGEQIFPTSSAAGSGAQRARFPSTQTGLSHPAPTPPASLGHCRPLACRLRREVGLRVWSSGCCWAVRRRNQRPGFGLGQGRWRAPSFG